MVSKLVTICQKLFCIIFKSVHIVGAKEKGRFGTMFLTQGR